MGKMWQPASFAEFRSKTLPGYVSIDISNEGYKQIPEPGITAGGITRMDERRLYAMTQNESTYRTIWNTNIDLYLHNEPDMTRIQMPFKVELMRWIASKFR